MNASARKSRKRHGVHYTPATLARFLAQQTVLQLPPLKKNQTIGVLDPACGDGELLLALIEALPCPASQICVTGFEQDADAAGAAESRLKELGVANCQIRIGDFLQFAISEMESTASGSNFDIVIANPPYVRTQVLGGEQSQTLARNFGLTGRVDLYHAFTIAMSCALADEGVLGLLTSNRFLTVKSGMAMRERLQADFELRDVFDLGDTKLFDASVLPVILTGVKKQPTESQTTGFVRVYAANRDAIKNGSATATKLFPNKTILELLADDDQSGLCETAEGRFLIERGELITVGSDSVWSLSNAQTRNWLRQIKNHQTTTFGELAEIKVGVKTTADSVFIRACWDDLPASRQPESELVRPLITHHDAQRWSGDLPTEKSILYPYLSNSPTRQPVSIEKFPRASAYLKSHKTKLSGRKYLIDAGRRWYEIWVPHQPNAWAQPKIVWPDISEQPKFFLDDSGAIVNGDCYWIKLREDVDTDWLYLMLAVANSTLATRFYDTVFHNKLYSGRRRFMTQYVKTFPLPALDSKLGKQIVRATGRQVSSPTAAGEKKIQRLVQQAFGFTC